MRIFIAANSYDGPAELTLFVNGSPTVLSTIITGGSTGDIDVPDKVAVLDGDKVSVLMDTSAVTGGLIVVNVSYEIGSRSTLCRLCVEGDGE